MSELLFLPVLLAVGGAALYPCLAYTPGRDSGVFLYIGQRILAGDIPYRDLWDHKPPLVFFINALGLVIGGGTEYGVRLLECVFFGGAVLLGYAALRKAFGAIPAFLGSLVWLLEFEHVHDMGNMPEEYALPLKFGTLLILVFMARGKTCLFNCLLLGFLTGLCFLLKQNQTAVGAAAVAVIAVQSIREMGLRDFSLRMGTIILGFAGAVLPAVWYLGSHGALADFWSSAFTFNFLYSATSAGNKLKFLMFGLHEVRIAPFILGIWGGCTASLFAVRKKPSPWHPYALFTVFILPFELLASSMQGRNYSHYLIGWLPAIAVIFALFIRTWQQWLLREYPLSGSSRKSFVPAVTAIGIGTLFLVTYLQSVANITHYNYAGNYPTGMDRPYENERAYVLANSGPGDFVLFWGAESRLNFATRRPSPTRLFYQYALSTKGYCSSKMVRQFADQVATNRPRLIIDTKNDELPPLDPAERTQWKGPLIEDAGIDRFFSFVNSEYLQKGHIGSWVVYGLRDSSPAPAAPQRETRPRPDKSR
jgi:hypothetical protein